MHMLPVISDTGWRIINCLQLFLSSDEIHKTIVQYANGSRTSRGYEAIVKMHLATFLIDVFGRASILSEVANDNIVRNKKNNRATTVYHDLFIRDQIRGAALEIKAYNNITGFEARYKKDYDKVHDFVLSGCGMNHVSQDEAYFVHYNLDGKRCQTQQILAHMKDTKRFDGSTSYVITKKKVCNVGEKGCLGMTPSFFLTFHRAGIAYQFGH